MKNFKRSLSNFWKTRLKKQRFKKLVAYQKVKYKNSINNLNYSVSVLKQLFKF